jgi:hypothetical protein
MLKQTGEQGFVLGESDDAIADVAGRQHVEFFAQASAGAAVIADGHDRAQFTDFRLVRFGRSPRAADIALESFEESGQTGAATDGDYMQVSS